VRVALVRAIPKQSVTEKEIGKCLDTCQEIVDMSVDEQGLSGRRGKHHSPFGETLYPLGGRT